MKFLDGTINLVNMKYGFDLLIKGLTSDSFSLNTDSIDAINYNEGTICNSKGGSNF